MTPRLRAVSSTVLSSILALACSGESLTPDRRDVVATAGSASMVPSSGGSAGLAGFTSGGSAGQSLAPSAGATSGGSAGGAASGGSGGSAGGSSVVGSGSSTSTGDPPVTTIPAIPGWKLIWSDEFDGADGSAVDGSKWQHDVGGHGFGNQELEYYTSDTKNSKQQSGKLAITATREGAASQSCWYGQCQFTSARLVTNGKFSVKYGRIEARMKNPMGKGVWPAFWMLGADIADVQWPMCGEIDIMEMVGTDTTTLHGTLHGPGYSGATPITGHTKLASGAPLSDDFHTYGVEWAADSIKWYLDGTLYQTITPATLNGKRWVYDHPFFLILNFAVGGQWPGSPDANTPFPQQLLVDYVRVYEAAK